MSPSAVKAAIRSKKKGWFEAKDGPRGWIAGPYLCIWNSALQQLGPMVLARVSYRDGTTFIRGRAGSDLNGTLALIAWSVLVAMMVIGAFLQGQALDQFAFVVLLYVISAPLILWMANSDKREADPLVRFLRRSVGSPTPNSTQPEEDERSTIPVTLNIDGEVISQSPTPEALRSAIQELSVDGFIILERTPQSFMQVLSRKEDFQLEKREGSASRHFQVHLPKGRSADDPAYDRSEREVIAVMTCYLLGESPSGLLSWKQIET